MYDHKYEQNWYAGETFDDLKELNLSFLHGNLECTPYHIGSLDPESNLILNELDTMNKLGMITVESQPYDLFNHHSSNNNHIVEQFPYVVFYYPHSKTPFLNEVLKHVEGVQAIMVDFEKNDVEEVVNISNEYFVADDIPANIVYDEYGAIVEFQPTPFTANGYKKYINEFLFQLGDNFESLVRTDLVLYAVNSTIPSNSMFNILIEAGKQCFPSPRL